METFKTQSIKSKLILSLYGHLTFIFRHCITNKAPKVAKSVAKVLNQKVAKLPSSSFFVFLLSSFLQMGYISQSWLKVAKLLNCSSFCCFSFSLEIQPISKLAEVLTMVLTLRCCILNSGTGIENQVMLESMQVGLCVKCYLRNRE